MGRVGTSRLSLEGVAAIQRKFREGRWANIPAFCRAFGIPRSTYFELIGREKWFEKATVQEKLTAIGISLAEQGSLYEFRTDASVVPQPTAVATNLPVQPTSFIGRAAEIATVLALVGKGRLITLTGAGGCGKTRLALQAAQSLLNNYADGIRLIELAPYDSAEIVPQTVLATLGVREEAGHSHIDALITFLKPRSLLLIVDNCEHLLAACASLATSILTRCPQVTILATSREALGISGESVWRVPPLMLPDSALLTTGKADNIATLYSYDAIRLFVERACAVRNDFALTSENGEQIVELCRKLDGMPLAIELSAARLSALSVDDINVRLNKRFQILSGGSRTALPRHQTLRALIDWSYDLLNRREQVLLQRLSVFAGGCTLDAAEVVCAGNLDPASSTEAGELPLPPTDIHTDDVVSLITSLVDKCLMVADTDGRVTRYRQLETVRQYARDRLAEAAESRQLSARHRDYYVAFAEKTASALLGAAERESLSSLNAEYENLRSAFEFSEAECDSVEMLRICSAMSGYWLVRGHLSEGRDWGERALRDLPAPSRLAIRSKVLCGLGQLAMGQSEYGAATKYFGEALANFQELSDPNGTARALDGLGSVAWYQGEYELARRYYTTSMDLHRKQGNRLGEAAALRGLGSSAYRQGDTLIARRYFEESLLHFRAAKIPSGIADALNNMGNVASSLGATSDARRYYDESLAIRRGLGVRDGVAQSLCNIGIIAYDQGDYPAAIACFNESLLICRQIGNRGGVAFAINRIGLVARAQEDYASAIDRFRESLEIRREIGDKQSLASTLGNIGKTVCSLGDLSLASSYLDEGLALAVAIDNRFAQASSLEGQAEIAVARGDFNVARCKYAEALQLTQARGDRIGIAGLIEAFASLAFRESEAQITNTVLLERAVTLWGVAASLRRKIGSPMQPARRAIYECDIESARAELGNTDFEARWRSGGAMAEESAIGFAVDAGAP